MDDVPHLQLGGGRGPDAHAIEDRPQAGPSREVRVERRPGRAGVDPGEHPDAALRPDYGDAFHPGDPRAFPRPRGREASMKIGVISKRPSYWSTQALLKSIKEHGHEPTLIKTDEVRLVVAGTDDATFSGASLRDQDVIIPRIGRSMTDF